MNQKGNSLIYLLVILFLLIIGSVVYFRLWKQVLPNVSSLACTQEAKICPDGSSVGRSGPNCEFPACPASQVTDCGSIRFGLNSSSDINVKQSEGCFFQSYTQNNSGKLSVNLNGSDGGIIHMFTIDNQKITDNYTNYSPNFGGKYDSNGTAICQGIQQTDKGLDVLSCGNLGDVMISSPSAVISPTPTCMPKPQCLNNIPTCMIAEPASGWCK